MVRSKIEEGAPHLRLHARLVVITRNWMYINDVIQATVGVAVVGELTEHLSQVVMLDQDIRLRLQQLYLSQGLGAGIQGLEAIGHRLRICTSQHCFQIC
jgi:hypothetical protein